MSENSDLNKLCKENATRCDLLKLAVIILIKRYYGCILCTYKRDGGSNDYGVW